MAVKPKSEGISIIAPQRGQLRMAVMGTSALVFNRVAEKAKRELLLPAGRRRSKADRAGTLKHEPMREFARDSVYRLRDSHEGKKPPTRLCFPSPAFKGAMTTAALDLPGTAKKEIGRLVWVEGTHVQIFGTPKLYMTIVRNSDMNHTPDVRTRAIIEQWACYVDVSFIMPNLNQMAIINLMTAAGLTAGIGDGRQEKGKLSFGQFEIVGETNPAFVNILKSGGVDAQDAALFEPEYYDEDSEELLSWFDEELARRIALGGEVQIDEVEEEELA